MFGTNVENNFVNFRRALEDIRRQIEGSMAWF